MKSVTWRFVLTGAVLLCMNAALFPARTAPECGRIAGRVIDATTGIPLAYVNIVVVGTTMGAMTVIDGRYLIEAVPAGTVTLKAMRMGYRTGEKRDVAVRAGATAEVDFELEETIAMKTEKIMVTGERSMVEVTASSVGSARGGNAKEMPVEHVVEACALSSGVVKTGGELHVGGGRARPHCADSPWRAPPYRLQREPSNTESYDRIYENEFLAVMDNPVSTFSIDVDAASYANVRRFVQQGTLPPPDAVRIEELINYFSYDYPEPPDSLPFSVTAEVAACPWNEENRLVHIGPQGRRMKLDDLPPSNLVFLLDVSGSMEPVNKLPLLKSAFRLLVRSLRPQDRIAIVVYAGAAGLVLPSVPGDHKDLILSAIGRLSAGGSTAGAAGIQLAYDVALEHFMEGGNNRVILATDGDFNVGVSSDAELTRMIEEKRKAGVFLTVLGFGMGNLKDSRMEKLADKGNGNYAYVDNILEAKKVLVDELGATLFTIAKDVKIQVEFNPAKVERYRLVGYENRLLKREDFDDDTKDAGELGAGHSVTALYEVVPVRVSEGRAGGKELRYIDMSVSPEALESPEILTVRLRYKPPDADASRLIMRTIADRGHTMEDVSDDFEFSASVAEFGLLLRNSQFKGTADYAHVLRCAKAAAGDDGEGYRREFIRIVEACRIIAEEGEESSMR